MPAFRDTRRKGNPWRYRKKIRLPDGSAVHIHGTPDRNTKLAAEAAERAHIDRANKQFYAKQSGAKTEKEVPTIEGFKPEFMDTYVRNNNKQSEIAGKESIFNLHIMPFCGGKRLDEFRRRDVEVFKAALRAKGLKNKRINNVLSVLGKMLAYSEEIELIEQAPSMHLLNVEKQKFRFLDFDEYEALLEAAEEEPEWRVAVLLAGSAGLRLGELRAFRWTDWEKAVKKIIISQAFWKDILGPTKGWNLRTIPLVSRLHDAMKECRHLRGPLVICNADGSPKKTSQMRKALPRLCKRAGIEEYSWHPLRHTFCSHLAMRGAPAKVIQELAGHADLSTTLKYMHLADGAKEQAIALLENPSSANRCVSVATPPTV